MITRFSSPARLRLPGLCVAALLAGCALSAPNIAWAQDAGADDGGGSDTAAPTTRKARPTRHRTTTPTRPATTRTDGAKTDGKSDSKAAAAGPGGSAAQLVATFGEWSAYTAQTAKGKICYALAQPKSRAPANIKDTPAYLFVSFRPADNVKNEVAAVLGFSAKDGGASDIAIGNTTYALVTKGSNGWVKNPADEPGVIATMSKASSLVVTATSARGNKTTDRYALSGFGQALDRARKDCP